MEKIQDIIETFCVDKGLEAAVFKLKWYNSSVINDKFKLDFCPEDSLAFVIISQPTMFEKCFLPFISDHWPSIHDNDIQDPLDQCMKHVFKQLSDALDHTEVKMFHDFELGPNRRPKVLVQTAGHISGAVRFYQEPDSNPDLLQRTTSTSKVYPVCLHPRFGGWFALRGVLIFPNVQVPELKMKSAPKVLKHPDQVSQLLNLYNNHWQDSRFRDCSDFIEERYSENQQDYFRLQPGPQRIKYLSTVLGLDL
jgi:methylmalonic aciduria homocystinuria type C protein